jgi:hypothetical protein
VAPFLNFGPQQPLEKSAPLGRKGSRLSLCSFLRFPGKCFIPCGFVLEQSLSSSGRPARASRCSPNACPPSLPPLTLDEALETTKVHSIVGQLAPGQVLITRRPFRAPHHTASDAGLLGGNINPTPGEISLAHHGVRFLDELPQFKRSVLLCPPRRRPGLGTVAQVCAYQNLKRRFPSSRVVPLASFSPPLQSAVQSPTPVQPSGRPQGHAIKNEYRRK